MKSRGLSASSLLHDIEMLMEDLVAIDNEAIPEIESRLDQCPVGQYRHESYLHEYSEHMDEVLDIIEEFIADAFAAEGVREVPTFGDRTWARRAMEVGRVGGLDREWDEMSLCDEVLDPLIRRFGYIPIREKRCEFPVGSTRSVGYIDFVLECEEKGAVALLEAKASIRNDRKLAQARDQALSYAVWEDLDVLLIGAKEGLWLYHRRRTECQLVKRWSIAYAWQNPREIREEIDQMGQKLKGI